MKFLSQIVKLILVIYFAKYVANQIILGHYLIGVVLFVGLIYFLVFSWDKKFILFSFMVFFSLAFPPYFPVPMNKWIELISPALCFLFILELLTKQQPLLSRKASLFFAAIGVLALWSVVNYVKNPVLGQLTFGVSYQEGGLRSYYIIFVGITTFLCSFWFFKYYKLNVRRWLFILLIFSLVIGNLYIIAFFKKLAILKYFALGSQGVSGLGSYYSSIPLRTMAGLGIPLLFSLFFKKRLNHYFVFIFLNLFVFVILGGGRAGFMAMVIVITVYFTLINRKYFFPVLSLLLILMGIYTMFFSDITFSEYKFGRSFTMKGGLYEQSKYRYYSFLYMWEVFKAKPVFGHGIAFHKFEVGEEFFRERLGSEHSDIEVLRKLREGTLLTGGHGAYLSILSVFGIGGFFWLIVMLFASMYYAYRVFKRDSGFQDDAMLALFVFLYLVRLSIAVTVGGEGYTNMNLWFVAGIIAGIMSKNEVKRKIELSRS